MRQPLPRKLEDALRSQPKFKPRQASPDEQLEELLGGRKGEDPYSVERKMLDDALGGPVAAPTVHGSAARKELEQTLAGRLSLVERQAAALREEVAGQNTELARLRRRNQALEVAAAEGGALEAAREAEALRAENQTLRQQIHEMETFLADYGLVWVGTQSTAQEPAAAAAAAVADPHSSAAFDFDLFIRKVQELNGLLDTAGPQVVSDGRKAKFEDQEVVQIVLFANGLCVQGGAFRAFGDAATAGFVRDVLVSGQQRSRRGGMGSRE